MDKQDLIIEIFYEVDAICLISRLAEFAIINEAKIDQDTYSILFWDLQKRSNRITEIIKNLEKLLLTPASKD